MIDYKKNPERYLITKDINNNVIEICDKESGVAYLKIENGWIWIV